MKEYIGKNIIMLINITNITNITNTINNKYFVL